MEQEIIKRAKQRKASYFEDIMRSNKYRTRI